VNPAERMCWGSAVGVAATLSKVSSRGSLAKLKESPWIMVAGSCAAAVDTAAPVGAAAFCGTGATVGGGAGACGGTGVTGAAKGSGGGQTDGVAASGCGLGSYAAWVGATVMSSNDGGGASVGGGSRDAGSNGLRVGALPGIAPPLE